MRHGHRAHRHALIALTPHHRVPHACPVWMANASDHAVEAFIRSLTDEDVREALREVRRAHHDRHFHHVTNLNARAQLHAALGQSRHALLLIGSVSPAGAGWTHKAGVRGGAARREKEDKEGKDSGSEEESQEKGRLVGIELQCQHAEEEEKHEGKGEGEGSPEGHEVGEKEKHKGSAAKRERKSRWAEAGEVLGVVPSANGTDTVKLRAKTERDPDWINWTGKGWKGFTHRGEEFAYKVPGFGLGSVLELLPEGGIWGARVPPKVIEVEAQDQDGGTSRAKIAVYADHMSTIKGRIGEKHDVEEDHEEAKQKILRVFYKLVDLLRDGVKKIPILPVKVEAHLPEGAWHLTMGFKEDLESNEVFMLVDLGAGFDPLFGIAVQFHVPMEKVFNIIPEKLREHLAEIEAYFELEGKFFLNVSVGRMAPRDLNVKGEVGGILGASLNFKVTIGASKVLRVYAKAGTEIKPEGLIQSDGIANGDEFKVYAKLLVEFGGMTGTVSWDLWDGKFTHENTWQFLGPQELLKTNKLPLFN